MEIFRRRFKRQDNQSPRESEIVTGPRERILLPADPIEASKRRLQLALKAIEYQQRLLDDTQNQGETEDHLSESDKLNIANRVKIITAVVQNGSANFEDFQPLRLLNEDIFDWMGKPSTRGSLEFVEAWNIVRLYAQAGGRMLEEGTGLPNVQLPPKNK
jgi:hypothetical protein